MNDMSDQDQSPLEDEEILSSAREEVEEGEVEPNEAEEGDSSFGSRLRSTQQSLRAAYDEVEKKGNADLVGFLRSYAVFIGISIGAILATIALSYYTDRKYIEVEQGNRTIQGLNISSQTYRAATVEAEQVISVRRQIQTSGLNLITSPMAPCQIEDKNKDAVTSIE